MNSDQSYHSYKEYEETNWVNTDSRTYRKWDHVLRSKHHLSTGHIHHMPYILIR